MYALGNMRRNTYIRIMATLRWISKCFRRLHISIQLPTEIILSCPSYYAVWYCLSTPPRTKIHPSFNKYVTKFTWSNKSIPVLLVKEYWLRRHLPKEPISYAGDWNLRWCSICPLPKDNWYLPCKDDQDNNLIKCSQWLIFFNFIGNSNHQFNI